MDRSPTKSNFILFVHEISTQVVLPLKSGNHPRDCFTKGKNERFCCLRRVLLPAIHYNTGSVSCSHWQQIYIYYDDGEQYFYKKRVSSVSNVIAWERREEIFKKSYFFLLIQWFVRRARRGNASGISLPTRRPDIIFRPAVRSRSCS